MRSGYALCYKNINDYRLKFGAPDRNRTCAPGSGGRALYPLSYRRLVHYIIIYESRQNARGKHKNILLIIRSRELNSLMATLLWLNVQFPLMAF